ncbi:MAG TPA: SCP2 sterol-binding domain-containing protein [Actinomycetota bacterium]|nr:SCP2 sterol-binding domain-containing protein [Actinomycetota bacterium]
MSDAIAEFLDALPGAGQVPLLEGVSGTLRIELEAGGQTEGRLIVIDRGSVSVSRRHAKADCTIRADRELFEGMVGGRVNAMAALLRGQIGVEGNPNLLLQFQRLFPSPPRPEVKRKRTRSTARQRS